MPTYVGTAGANNVSNSTDDVMYGLDGDDTLSSGLDDVRIYGGEGADVLNYIDGAAGGGYLSGDGGDDKIDGGSNDDTILGGEGDDTVTAFGGADLIDGGTGEDSLLGQLGDDTIYGGEGDDTLDGGEGVDKMFGGGGSDIFYVDNALDQVGESIGQGFDTVVTIVSYTLDASAEIEDFAVLNEGSTGAIDLTGNDFAQLIVGNDGTNVISGRGGSDVLYGEGGDDTLDGGDGDDTLVGGEGSNAYIGGEGYDQVNYGQEAERVEVSLEFNTSDAAASGDTYVSIEDVFGSAYDDLISGTSGVQNILQGGAGNDTLYGYGGGDTLEGGADADRLQANVAEGVGALDAFDGGGGVDEISAFGSGAIDFRQSAIIDVERLFLVAPGAAQTSRFTAAQFAFAEVVAEPHVGGSVVIGIDATAPGATNVSLASVTVTGMNQPNDRFEITGGSSDQTLTGSSIADRIDGGAGADTMAGGAGNDTYTVDNLGDVVTETSGAGTDMVRAAINYTLGAEVENLALIGGTAVTATGNGLANQLIGTNNANTLNGLVGADTMTGLGGDDIYIVDTSGDQVVEAVNGGTDTVRSSIDYTLTANVETLILTGGTSVSATGNALNNTIQGTNNANTLNGLVGADTMTGYGGADTYIVDNAGDVVVEAANGGTDTVRSSINHTLAANVENLTLTGGTAIIATGNTLANVLQGTNGANTLNGLGGSDTMTGFGGSDTFAFSAAAGSQNIDTITDFRHVDDTIQLARTAFAGLTAGALSSDAFWSGAGVTTAHDQTDQIIYNTTTGDLFFDRDGSKTQFAAVKFATLTGSPDDVAANDFTVV